MLLLALLACTPKEDSVPPDSEETFCTDVPIVNWDNFGHGFMLENCQGCHASTAINRYSAPEGVYFDTKEDCWQWAERILARSTGESPDMPPRGGPSEDDRTRLEWWLRCAPEGT